MRTLKQGGGICHAEAGTIGSNEAEKPQLETGENTREEVCENGTVLKGMCHPMAWGEGVIVE